MRTPAKLARTGNRIIDVIEAVLIFVMLLYGGYSLWDNYRIEHRAFVTDELLQYKPSKEDTESLAELMELNPDVLGWIEVDDTHIDYPVVQGEDDMEYINKDVHGDFALSGSIFLSTQNSKEMTDPYNIIYGHHMDNGAMFGDITKFTKKKYFKSHKEGTLYLLDRSIELEIFAVVKTDAADSVVYNPEVTDTENILAYVKENAVRYREIDITSEDQIVALSTCSDTTTNERVIVYAKLGKETKTNNGGVKADD